MYDVFGLDLIAKKEDSARHVLKIILADIEVGRDGYEQVLALGLAQLFQLTAQILRPPIAHDFQQSYAAVGMAKGKVRDHHGLFEVDHFAFPL